MNTGEWLKVFNQIQARWNDVTTIDPGHGCGWSEQPLPCEYPEYTLSPGSHTVQISGRSSGFGVDQVIVRKVSEACNTLGRPPNSNEWRCHSDHVTKYNQVFVQARGHCPRA